MTLFMLSAVTLTLIILLIVLSSLWRKPQSQRQQRREQNIHIVREQLAALDESLAAGEISEAEYQQQRGEVEASLLEDVGTDETRQTVSDNTRSTRRSAYALMILLPLFVAAGYLYIGTPEALEPQANSQVAGHGTGSHQNLASVDDMLLRLEQRLAQQPDDLNGWLMAGRSYMALQQYSQAAQAFKRAYELDRHNAAIMFRYADALAMSHNGRLSGVPYNLLQQGLQLEPDNVMGLWLSGNAYAEQQKFAEAIKAWQRARQFVSTEPDSVRELDMMIANAQQQLAGTAKLDKAAVDNAEADKQAAVTAAGITVRVSLAAELAPRVNADDAVFILAKALRGPPMPLAVVRKQVRDLPLTIQLSADMAMAAGMSLANFNDVLLVARVSKSGLARAAEGDLIAELPVRNWKSAKAQILVIDRIQGPR